MGIGKEFGISSVVTGQKEESFECDVGPGVLVWEGSWALDISLHIVSILFLNSL